MGMSWVKYFKRWCHVLSFNFVSQLQCQVDAIRCFLWNWIQTFILHQETTWRLSGFSGQILVQTGMSNSYRSFKQWQNHDPILCLCKKKWNGMDPSRTRLYAELFWKNTCTMDSWLTLSISMAKYSQFYSRPNHSKSAKIMSCSHSYNPDMSGRSCKAYNNN